MSLYPGDGLDGNLSGYENYYGAQTPFDQADNGTVNSNGSTSQPSWMSKLFDTALSVGGAVATSALTTKGATQAQNTGIVTASTAPKGAAPASAAAATGTKTSYLPWIIGGVAALALGFVAFMFTRKRGA